MLQGISPIIPQSTTSVTISTLNDGDSTLFGVDCPVCHNTGSVIRRDENGHLWSRECECMAKRRTLRNIRNSGISDMCRRYTFESYTAEDAETRHALDKAREYARSGSRWWYICGRPGSGKTHLCTAICNDMLNRGVEVKYMLWREAVPKLKALVNDNEGYAALMGEYKRADTLYIDDFLKGSVTDADLNLAFELINARYNDAGKRTIISSERTIEDVLKLDDAVGSRIAERAKGFCVAAPRKNWRLA